ncbi:hypothetical protein B0J11DRAFT_584397 [Dendryphion nanum]|uniref:Uncharacterized protein n=1 Tax=Dendryphion nanum TaxID=256645 RepID=A0A9P9DA43_9PLEO|nr:hypothetical protein B0J11DRAFT_584397 [Dendryphion nanum]
MSSRPPPPDLDARTIEYIYRQVYTHIWHRLRTWRLSPANPYPELPSRNDLLNGSPITDIPEPIINMIDRELRYLRGIRNHTIEHGRSDNAVHLTTLPLPDTVPANRLDALHRFRLQEISYPPLGEIDVVPSPSPIDFKLLLRQKMSLIALYVIMIGRKQLIQSFKPPNVTTCFIELAWKNGLIPTTSHLPTLDRDVDMSCSTPDHRPGLPVPDLGDFGFDFTSRLMVTHLQNEASLTQINSHTTAAGYTWRWLYSEENNADGGGALSNGTLTHRTDRRQQDHGRTTSIPNTPRSPPMMGRSRHTGMGGGIIRDPIPPYHSPFPPPPRTGQGQQFLFPPGATSTQPLTRGNQPAMRIPPFTVNRRRENQDAHYNRRYISTTRPIAPTGLTPTVPQSYGPPFSSNSPVTASTQQLARDNQSRLQVPPNPRLFDEGSITRRRSQNTPATGNSPTTEPMTSRPIPRSTTFLLEEEFNRLTLSDYPPPRSRSTAQNSTLNTDRNANPRTSETQRGQRGGQNPRARNGGYQAEHIEIDSDEDFDNQGNAPPLSLP